MENKPKLTGSDGHDYLGGRLPLLNPKRLNIEQKELYNRITEKQVLWAEKNNFIAALPDGRLIGPFNFHLRSPALSKRYLAWVDAESVKSILSPKMREIIILTVGVAWKANYESYAHTAVGRIAGLTDAIINAIKCGQQPEGLDPEELAVYQFTSQLANRHRIDEATYKSALVLLTEQGIIDMVHLTGAYLATSVFLNAFEVPTP